MTIADSLYDCISEIEDYLREGAYDDNPLKREIFLLLDRMRDLSGERPDGEGFDRSAEGQPLDLAYEV